MEILFLLAVGGIMFFLWWIMDRDQNTNRDNEIIRPKILTESVRTARKSRKWKKKAKLKHIM